MLNKRNLKHILILALGFSVCSSIFLTESTILSNLSNTKFSNIIAASFGNLAMALGILFFILIYQKTKNIKKHYILSTLISIISLITFFTTKNVLVMSICLCLYCFLEHLDFVEHTTFQ